jgi:hypothetical protein
MPIVEQTSMAASGHGLGDRCRAAPACAPGATMASMLTLSVNVAAPNLLETGFCG